MEIRNKIATAMSSTILAIAAMVSLAGCSTLAAMPSIPQAVAVAQAPLDKTFNTVADEQAYYGLLKFEKVANELASASVDLGIVTAGSPTAVRIADLLLKLTDVTNAAKQAKRLNDTAGVMGKVNEGKALYSQIIRLVRG